MNNKIVFENDEKIKKDILVHKLDILEEKMFNTQEEIKKINKRIDAMDKIIEEIFVELQPHIFST